MKFSLKYGEWSRKTRNDEICDFGLQIADLRKAKSRRDLRFGKSKDLSAWGLAHASLLKVKVEIRAGKKFYLQGP